MISAPGSPARKVPRHGTDILGETYAYDLIRTNPGTRATRFYRASPLRYLLLGVRLQECHGWGQPIYSPSDATYVVRDGPVVFYVGQSYVAFDRVRSHFYGGFKARSLLGRLILCNWPASMHWTVELLSSQLERFAAVEHQLDAVERLLIQDLAPCLNEAVNRQPTPLPEVYRPPTATPTCPRSPNKLIREAGYALKAEQRREWLDTGG